MTRRVLFGLVAALVALPVLATDAPGKAAIASAHPLATEAGMEILAQGGNAFDAAVAVSAAVGVLRTKGAGPRRGRLLPAASRERRQAGLPRCARGRTGRRDARHVSRLLRRARRRPFDPDRARGGNP